MKIDERKYKERVELHCHTGFSEMDGTCSVRDILSFVKEQGMSSVAFTDHGNVNAYPTIQSEARDYEDIKPIYGMEAYVVNDLVSVVENGDSIKDISIDSDVVVFDVETTGFSPVTDEIIEIGAVKITNGKIAEIYQSFVKPSNTIPEFITKLTGITDGMVSNESSIGDVLPEFLDFIGDAILVAHNASFDTSFLNENAKRLSMPFNNASVDTLSLVRLLLVENKRGSLTDVAEFLNINIENAHRASDDACTAAQIYIELVKRLKDSGIENFGQINALIKTDEHFIKKSPRYHVSILAKNELGIKALYSLVSESNTKYFDYKPRVPMSRLMEMRDGLLIGSGCNAGMLGCAVKDGKSEESFMDIARYFDYLEVQPINELQWMIDYDDYNGIDTVEDFIEYNKKIIDIGEKTGIPVVAISDVHYFRPENGISRSVVMADVGFSDYKDPGNMYFRTTAEMLEDFSYLGEDKAFEIVVENTNKIAEQIEHFKPLNIKRISYYKEGDYEKLESLCYEGLKKRYGDQADLDNISNEIRVRLLQELKSIKDYQFACYYLWFYELIHNNNLNPSQYNLRGLAGSSLVCYLLGISHVNPFDSEVPLYCEFFQGNLGDKYPDIDMNFDVEIWQKLLDSTKDLTGIKTTYRAGTVCVLGEQKTEEMIDYYEEEGNKLTDEQKAIIRHDLSCVVTRRGMHPGGMIMIPEGVEEFAYAPVVMNEERTEKTLAFDYHEIDHIFDKIDILRHDNCTLNARLYEAIGYYPTDDDIRSDEILALITNPNGLNMSGCKNYGISTGLLAIPGFMNAFTLMLVDTLQPKTISDLVKLEGISHGTNTWLENGEKLFNEGTATLKDMIGSREDVYEVMLKYGIDKNVAYAIAEDVRKGKMCKGRMKPELKEAMINAGVPEWYIWSCDQIRYLFPRAHAAEYVQMELRTLYYKLHYPEIFYPLFFELYGSDKFKEFYSMGIDGLDQMNYYLMTDKKATLEDMYFYKIWNEYRLRKTTAMEG